ncbi:sensor histidine kinase [Paracoccus spongiarum]|uniref:histidine kinase n=1 Tax=Paracoccus spongiarum TaxID=3064387 RepID=A0ABT9J7H2_9RHOB|nr:HAMP domain-containing sensor histidine kinase [Paracoccus sp. 2205BS29-5]MDP5305758.1 HAMP domain-containing sensor histidine kinase [Paracoccus sp. 2205BS29-5]
MRPASLRWRLMLAGGVAVLVVLALSALGLTVLFDRHAERVAVADLKARATALAAMAEPRGDAPPRLGPPPRDPLYERPFSGHYWQISLGDALARSRSLWDAALPLADDPPPPGRWRIGSADGPRGQRLLLAETSLLVGGGAQPVTMHIAVAEDRAELAAARQSFLGDLVPFLALLGGLLVATFAAQAGIGLRPLARIGARVDSLAQGLRPRIGGDLPAEVMPLAGQIDRLLDDRDRELARARHRAGDLAHGFKTPLQALLGDAAQLRDRGQAGIAAEIEAVVLTMRRHVDRELARARIQSDRGHAACHPAEVLSRLVRVLRRMPEGARLDWRLDAPAGLKARIDADDLTEALGALMENAMRHAATRVEARLHAEAGRVLVAIRDDGPGVPDTALGGLQDRGVRLDEGGDGQGIGLAITAEIVEAAGGRLRLENAGPGLRAIMALPRAG